MHSDDVRDNFEDNEHSTESVFGSTRRLSHRFVSPDDARNSYLPRVPGAVLESSMQKGKGKGVRGNLMNSTDEPHF